MNIFVKQPNETFFISAGITNVISDEESIVLGSCTAVAVDCNGDSATSDILSGALALDGTTKIKIRVKAGTVALSRYKITFNIITDAGNNWEIDVFMQVRET